MKRTIKVHKFIKYSGYAILLLVFSITIHSWYFYLQVPKKTFEELKTTKYDAIIVPGVPYDAGNWSLFFKWRMHWSAFLYKQGLTNHIIYSGSAVHTEFVEANIMKRFGEKLGIPSDRILIENKAEHSSENLYYSYILAKESGFKKIALATDPFQSDLLDNFIVEHQLDVDLIPIVYSIADTINMFQPLIDYKDEIIEGFVPLKNREDFAKRISGTAGQRINWENLKKYRD